MSGNLRPKSLSESFNVRKTSIRIQFEAINNTAISCVDICRREIASSIGNEALSKALEPVANSNLRASTQTLLCRATEPSMLRYSYINRPDAEDYIHIYVQSRLVQKPHRYDLSRQSHETSFDSRCQNQTRH